MTNNYINTKDKFKYFFEIMLNNADNNKQVNINENIDNDIMKKIDDFCEYKSSLLEVLKISLLIYTNVLKKDISSYFENILNYLFDEIRMSSILKHKNSLLSSSKIINFNHNFISLLIEIVSRLCLYNPQNFGNY